VGSVPSVSLAGLNRGFTRRIDVFEWGQPVLPMAERVFITLKDATGKTLLCAYFRAGCLGDNRLRQTLSAHSFSLQRRRYVADPV
jgi:hypothetical protein